MERLISLSYSLYEIKIAPLLHNRDYKGMGMGESGSRVVLV